MHKIRSNASHVNDVTFERTSMMHPHLDLDCMGLMLSLCACIMYTRVHHVHVCIMYVTGGFEEVEGWDQIFIVT